MKLDSANCPGAFVRVAVFVILMHALVQGWLVSDADDVIVREVIRNCSEMGIRQMTIGAGITKLSTHNLGLQSDVTIFKIRLTHVKITQPSRI